MKFKYKDILKNNARFMRVVENMRPMNFKHFEVECLRFHDFINNQTQWQDIKKKYLDKYDPTTGLHQHQF